MVFLMTTDEPLVQINTKSIDLNQNLNENSGLELPAGASSASVAAADCLVSAEDGISKGKGQEIIVDNIDHPANYNQSNFENLENQPCDIHRLVDDTHSIISLSSSTTTEAGGFDGIVVPDVGFDTINLDGCDSRESQPLLGSRDQAEVTCNSFPGTFFILQFLINETPESLANY